jgi:hypothetical protein
MRSRLAIVVSYVALSCCALPQAMRKVAGVDLPVQPVRGLIP